MRWRARRSTRDASAWVPFLFKSRGTNDATWDVGYSTGPCRGPRGDRGYAGSPAGEPDARLAIAAGPRKTAEFLQEIVSRRRRRGLYSRIGRPMGADRNGGAHAVDRRRPR